MPGDTGESQTSATGRLVQGGEPKWKQRLAGGQKSKGATERAQPGRSDVKGITGRVARVGTFR